MSERVCAGPDCGEAPRARGRFCSDDCYHRDYRAKLVRRPKILSDALCECGCGRRTYLFRGKPRRFLVGHSYRLKVVDKYFIDFETECWNWAGALSGGRGMVMRFGQQMWAYRWMYVRMVGPIPEGCVLHHTCENGRCVNPAHLEPMTRADHSRLHGFVGRPV